MPTPVIHTIAADGSGDYTNLTAWQNDQQRDLVLADEIAIAEVVGVLDLGTSRFIVTGWDTDEDHPVIIRAKAGQEALGRQTGGFAKVITNNSSGEAIRVQRPHVNIIDLYLENSNASGLAPLSLADPYGKAIRCVGVSNTNSTSSSAYVFRGNDGGTEFAFCIAINKGDTPAGGFRCRYGDEGNTKLINCVAIGGGTAFDLGSVGPENTHHWPLLINCVELGAAVNYDINNLTRVAEGTRNNASANSDAATIPGDFSVTDVIQTDFIDPGLVDGAWLSSSTGKLADAGHDHGLYSTDITGETITDWFIGAGFALNEFKSLFITGTARPGATLGVEFNNFDGIPATVTVTDSADNELVIDVDEDNGDYSITLPSLPAVSTNSPGLLFGDITISAADPGE
jgi:hypothetical protein